MIKGIISSKINGRHYFVGETSVVGVIKLQVVSIDITVYWQKSGSPKKDIYVVKFSNGSELRVPFGDYEMFYTPEEE